MNEFQVPDYLKVPAIEELIQNKPKTAYSIQEAASTIEIENDTIYFKCQEYNDWKELLGRDIIYKIRKTFRQW